MKQPRDGAVETCLTKDCGKEVKTISFIGLCGTCYQRTWRARNPEPLPKHVEERHAFPYRNWLTALYGKNNVVHCMSKVKLFGGDDWETVPLCDTDAQLRPSSPFRLKPRHCKRCVSILSRCGFVEDWTLIA